MSIRNIHRAWLFPDGWDEQKPYLRVGTQPR